jgi:methylenetetrahydrofolate reductase (NADPH)
MRVVVELVPRDPAALAAQLGELAPLRRVDAINVPDLARFALRGWQAALAIREHQGGRFPAVPHVRAMDVDLRTPWAPQAALTAAGVDEVLVITGDPPTDLRQTVTGAGVLDVIRTLKRANPGWRVYAALDPYRSGFAQERDYALRKLDAGADGFFTQPFFDVRLMGVWRDLMGDVPVFWGVTSVTSERSMRYWTARNRAVFPAGFEPTLAWHRRLAADALTFGEHHDAHVYFMPIRVHIDAWLGDVLG